VRSTVGGGGRAKGRRRSRHRARCLVRAPCGGGPQAGGRRAARCAARRGCQSRPWRPSRWGLGALTLRLLLILLLSGERAGVRAEGKEGNGRSGGARAGAWLAVTAVVVAAVRPGRPGRVCACAGGSGLPAGRRGRRRGRGGAGGRARARGWAGPRGLAARQRVAHGASQPQRRQRALHEGDRTGRGVAGRGGAGTERGAHRAALPAGLGHAAWSGPPLCSSVTCLNELLLLSCSHALISCSPSCARLAPSLAPLFRNAQAALCAGFYPSILRVDQKERYAKVRGGAGLAAAREAGPGCRHCRC
jgi:hypothetical protein